MPTDNISFSVIIFYRRSPGHIGTEYLHESTQPKDSPLSALLNLLPETLLQVGVLAERTIEINPSAGFRAFWFGEYSWITDQDSLISSRNANGLLVAVEGVLADKDPVVFTMFVKAMPVYKRYLEQKPPPNSGRDAGLHNPWISGSFYLTSVVLIGGILVALAKTIGIMMLPIATASIVLIVSVIGAFQLRQDARLTEQSFLKLMLMTLKRVPFLISKRRER